MRAKITSWRLPDALLVDVYLRLTQDLAENPARRLERTRQPFDGMTYRFSQIDPDNRLSVYHFSFHLVYSQDEETLIVVHGGFAHEYGV